jgi:hypothetical protein
MRPMLLDVVRQATPLFDKIRVEGKDLGTRVEAYSDDKMLFLFADLKDVIPEFAGEFGISNLSLLKGLLDFASYKTDDAQLQVRRSSREDTDYVTELEFADTTGGRTRFKTINPRMIGDRAKLADVAWDVTVTPSKAKLAEVVQLTGMLAEVDQHFSVLYEGQTLFLIIGSKVASNHNARVALATEVEPVTLPSGMVFKAPHFLAVLKKAGSLPCTIRFAERGLANILVETEHGQYSYILRGAES